MESIAFRKLFSPVVRYVTFSLIVAVAPHRIVLREQMNIKSALISASLTVEHYVQQPERFVWRDARLYATGLARQCM